MKHKILNELLKRTSINEIKENDIFTASSLANTLDISRNTVSQYLNEYIKQNEVIKVNTRPVYFFHREELEKRFQVRFKIFIFENINDLKQQLTNSKKDFQKMIGFNNSLKSVVEHCKAAISYPGCGLPILIHGPTGTGKSLLASLSYEYALNQKILASKTRLISINCSEYANNPELLTANLFGYVKGAYTGAEEDNPGLLSLANEGILFLDEVHCLNAACQEKLFFFMDKGMYHKVGDNDNWYQSNCRLLFATTEDPQNALLKTLLRRIPITVFVPSLKDRPLLEKKQLIYSILSKESIQLKKSIVISNIAYQTLMDFEFTGNVGGMKNVLKATCANAFLTHSETGKLEIHIYDLPDYIFRPITTVQVKISSSEETMIPLEQLQDSTEFSSPLLHLYDNIVNLLNSYVKNKESYTDFIDKFYALVQNYIDFVVYKNRYRKNANDDFLLKVLDKIYSIIMNKYSLNVPNNEIQIYSKVLSEYTKYIVDAKVWVSFKKDKVDTLINVLQENAPRAFSIANEVIDNAALNLDLELDDVMLAIITVSFMSYERRNTLSSAGLILCHGYSTASSIADTVNKMIGQYVFDGIDMQIDLSVDKVAMLADEYLKRKTPLEELILLVDMGSLEEIYTRIKPIANCNIALMNNVSTKMALEAGNKIIQGQSINDILSDIKREFNLSTHYIQAINKKEAILTICATGFGAAQKFSELLNSSLPYHIPLEIIPYDYQNLVENGCKDVIFDKYDIKLLVGTMNPKITNLPFISVEQLMMDEELTPLKNLISNHLKTEEVERFQQNIMKNFTLSNIVNHLTILNAEKVIDDVEEIVSEIEKGLGLMLDSTKKAGLYIHLSCLIERLILKNEITLFENSKNLIEANQTSIDIIKETFSGVENRYSVVVPEAEMLYILNYFKNA